MVTLLAKHFIPHYKDTKSPEVRHSYGMLCGIVGILLNILLFIGKFIAGTLSHSIAITADALNNLSDAGFLLLHWQALNWPLKSRIRTTLTDTDVSNIFPAYSFPCLFC